jgi:hypothetical protein
MTSNPADVTLERGLAAGRTPRAFDEKLRKLGLPTDGIALTRAFLSRLLVEGTLFLYNNHYNLSLKALKHPQHSHTPASSPSGEVNPGARHEDQQPFASSQWQVDDGGMELAALQGL